MAHMAVEAAAEAAELVDAHAALQWQPLQCAWVAPSPDDVLLWQSQDSQASLVTGLSGLPMAARLSMMGAAGAGTDVERG